MYDAASFTIGPPPPRLERRALEQAYEALPIAQRKSAVEETLRAAERGERSLDGLLAAWRDDDVAGALWAEIYPGENAALWLPQLAVDAPRQLGDTLLAQALSWLKARHVDLVQSLLATDVGEDAERLQRAGFEHSCDLLYLASSAEPFPASALAAELVFEPVRPDQHDDLARLVEQTYEQTLDCPALDGGRDGRQALAGYRATCRDDLSHWYIVRHRQERIGCLLLGHDVSASTWELIYMGIVPAARGRGWGLEVVRHAQSLVAQAKAERLVLAVDAANEPALRIYAAAGFAAWDKRSVFLKWLSTDRPSSDGNLPKPLC
ncbi:MAG TPA: GNAT family N-acetyltransferase [Pirellulales bacterium]|nr:GNAT family N-acetyltransferase [Pirellulales bacterium]